MAKHESSVIYWFTGQPGSGKSTLAKALVPLLETERENIVVHLDGDEFRQWWDNKDYSDDGRKLNIQRAQWLAKKLAKGGVTVVASFVSPNRELREQLKAEAFVVEIYTHTTTVRGKEDKFAPNYEPPLKDYIDMDTTDVLVDACVKRILDYVRHDPSI